jgi:hypothetical protein
VAEEERGAGPLQQPCCSPNVALADQDAGVVDGLGQALLEDERLQAALQEVLQVGGRGGDSRQVEHILVPQILVVLEAQPSPVPASVALWQSITLTPQATSPCPCLCLLTH